LHLDLAAQNRAPVLMLADRHAAFHADSHTLFRGCAGFPQQTLEQGHAASRSDPMMVNTLDGVEGFPVDYWTPTTMTANLFRAMRSRQAIDSPSSDQPGRSTSFRPGAASISPKVFITVRRPFWARYAIIPSSRGDQPNV